MSRQKIFGGSAAVLILGRFFCRYTVLITLLAVTIIFGILVAPSRSHAQNGVAANQGASQAATPPAATPQGKKIELPEGDGKAIAEKSCHECHELTNVTHASKSLDDWRETVRIMMDNGADVPADKIDALVNYLAKNFGPNNDTPPADAQVSPSESVELPDGDGKEIATNSCQVCHKLRVFMTAHKTLDDWRDTVRLMRDRGAVVAPSKVETLVQYLAKNFGPKDPPPAVGATPTSPAQQH